jgi:hypothetical protein
MYLVLTLVHTHIPNSSLTLCSHSHSHALLAASYHMRNHRF